MNDELRSLFAGPNFAHLATLLPDGSPHSVALWAGLEGDDVVFFTQEASRKARNLRADGRLAISLVDVENPYLTGWVRGRVASTIEGDAALEIIDRLSVKYTGEPFPYRQGTVYVVEVTKSGTTNLPFRHTPARGR